MKKYVIISALLCLFVSPSAVKAGPNDDFSVLPVKIKCTSKAKSQEAKKFEIDDLDSDRPDSTISDASMMDVDIKGKTYSVGFSNECDNSYSLTFKVADLVKLKSRKFKFVIGELDYFDSWLSEANGDEGETENEKVSVYCTL
jgi:hypothetical protein